MIDKKLFQPGDHANALDADENKADVYLVAFDLNQYKFAWSHGTDRPGVGWSDQFANLKNLSKRGPDGFDSLEPLRMNGLVNPTYLPDLVGTMCGGFQRYHSVFKSGPFSQRPDHSYYGFLQEGVVFSRMNPDLATVIMYKDGNVDIKSWSDSDEAHSSEIRYARQNGVPIVMRDSSGRSVPGDLVNDDWGGNWSGSADNSLRTVRAGACLAQNNGHRYLIYAYFSAAKPSAMARVFQAYDCDYAIHLDMNSPGQSYLGLISSVNGQTTIEHPLADMSAFDSTQTVNGQSISMPRYAGVPDQADFFYILRR